MHRLEQQLASARVAAANHTADLQQSHRAWSDRARRAERILMNIANRYAELAIQARGAEAGTYSADARACQEVAHSLSTLAQDMVADDTPVPGCVPGGQQTDMIEDVGPCGSGRARVDAASVRVVYVHTNKSSCCVRAHYLRTRVVHVHTQKKVGVVYVHTIS